MQPINYIYFPISKKDGVFMDGRYFASSYVLASVCDACGFTSSPLLTRAELSLFFSKAWGRCRRCKFLRGLFSRLRYRVAEQICTSKIWLQSWLAFP